MSEEKSHSRAIYGVPFGEYLGENWPRYNGTALYKVPFSSVVNQWTLLLTWFNFNPSMDK